MKKFIRLFVIVTQVSAALLLFGTPGFAKNNVLESDSVQTKKDEPAWHIRSTARFHTKGIFAFGGRIPSTNPAFDINFIYERKQWGLMVFKAVDLVDHTSQFNFSLAVLYKNFKISKRITITPNVGTFLEQSHSVADHGSDIATIIITSIKLNPSLTLDHTAVLGNLVIEPEARDWVNRIRLMYSKKHLDVTGWFWHNNHVFDEADYVSTGLTIGYSRMKLSKHVNLSVSVTELSVLHTSDEEAVPKSNQFVFTLAAQVIK